MKSMREEFEELEDLLNNLLSTYRSLKDGKPTKVFQKDIEKISNKHEKLFYKYCNVENVNKYPLLISNVKDVLVETKSLYLTINTDLEKNEEEKIDFIFSELIEKYTILYRLIAHKNS